MFPAKVETRILLNCPRCRFSSRYDTGFLEDAIHDAKEISCVACGGHFRLSIVAVDSRITQHAVDLPIICADCGATERFEDVCKQCGSPNTASH